MSAAVNAAEAVLASARRMLTGCGAAAEAKFNAQCGDLIAPLEKAKADLEVIGKAWDCSSGSARALAAAFVVYADALDAIGALVSRIIMETATERAGLH